MHDKERDGFKKRKKNTERSEKDLLLLSNYRNKNIPSGSCTYLIEVFPHIYKKIIL